MINVKKMIIKICCWFISALMLFLWVVAFNKNPGGAIIQHDLFFVRYAIHILFFNIWLVVLVGPFLMQKGIVSNDYNHDNEYEKAKSDVVILTMSLPGLVSIFTAMFLASKIKFSLVMLFTFVLLFKYINSIYCLVRCKNIKRGQKGAEKN